MSKRFNKNDYVVYGKMGVCQVDRREMLSFGEAGSGEYYVLIPMSDRRSFVYVPCDNDLLMARLRPIFTKAEIDEILHEVTQGGLCWIEDKSTRTQFFRDLIAEGDRRQLLRLIRCLYEKKGEKTAAGKKLSAADEATLHDCVRLVEEEFSVSLGIRRSEVEAYICNSLDASE